LGKQKNKNELDSLREPRLRVGTTCSSNLSVTLAQQVMPKANAQRAAVLLIGIVSAWHKWEVAAKLIKIN